MRRQCMSQDLCSNAVHTREKAILAPNKRENAPAKKPQRVFFSHMRERGNRYFRQLDFNKKKRVAVKD